MPTTAFSSQGAELKVTISATPTVIPNIKNLSLPSVVRTIANITNLGSTGNFAEKKPLMNDTDTLSFSAIWDNTNAAHDYLMDQSLLATAVLDTFLFTSPDTGAATLSFTGYVTKCKGVVSTNEIMMLEVEVTVTGALVYVQ